jgi:type VI secretion system protein ImpB
MTEGSVAPKERINIVYESKTGGAAEDVELPLKLLVLGDFTVRNDSRALGERAPVNIDKDSFKDVMRKHELSLLINVPDRLSGEEGAELPVHLKIETLEEFGPESLARQVPELTKLLQLREALKALKGPLGEIRDFRKAIERLLADDSKREQLYTQLGIGSDTRP